MKPAGTAWRQAGAWGGGVPALARAARHRPRPLAQRPFLPTSLPIPLPHNETGTGIEMGAH